MKDAYENARFLCDQYYLTSPELEICKSIGKFNHAYNIDAPKYFIVFNFIDADDEPIKIVYVPSHLYHILFELFKNSMRATVEHHKTDILPPLHVTIVKGKEDVCVKVSLKMVLIFALYSCNLGFEVWKHPWFISVAICHMLMLSKRILNIVSSIIFV